MGTRRETITIGLLCVTWYILSSASNVVGKLVLTDLPYPVTVTMVQLLSTVLYSIPAFALFNIRRAPTFPLRFYIRVLIPLAFAKFFTTMFSQISIWKVPISYAHTVKATTPLWTAALARILFGERQPGQVQGALVLIAVGVGIASLTELHFDGVGLGAALASAALLSLQHLFSKRVMRDTGAHHLRVLQTLSVLALAMLAPAWAWAEGLALIQAQPLQGWDRAGGLLALDGALAWLQAVAAFSVLSRVTPLAYAVASAAKRAAVVLASLLLLGNPSTPLNLAGMALAGMGVLAYNRAKINARESFDQKPLLPI